MGVKPANAIAISSRWVHWAPLRRLVLMAHRKKDHLAKSPQWWKHLREFKRLFWKRERRLGQRLARKEAQPQSTAES